MQALAVQAAPGTPITCTTQRPAAACPGGRNKARDLHALSCILHPYREGHDSGQGWRKVAEPRWPPDAVASQVCAVPSIRPSLQPYLPSSCGQPDKNRPRGDSSQCLETFFGGRTWGTVLLASCGRKPGMLSTCHSAQGRPTRKDIRPSVNHGRLRTLP